MELRRQLRYLDEFVFRHNRRRTPMAAFQTLLGLAPSDHPSPTRGAATRRPAAWLHSTHRDVSREHLQVYTQHAA